MLSFWKSVTIPSSGTERWAIDGIEINTQKNKVNFMLILICTNLSLRLSQKFVSHRPALDWKSRPSFWLTKNGMPGLVCLLRYQLAGKPGMTPLDYLQNLHHANTLFNLHIGWKIWNTCVS